MNPPSTRFITLAQLLDACKGILSEATLRRCVHDGRIQHMQPAGKGGKLLFPHDALDRMLQAQSENAANQTPASTLDRARWAR